MTSNSKDDLSRNQNNTSIDIILEATMKDFLEKVYKNHLFQRQKNKICP